ncbi:MAG: hypothetical protein LQ340_003370 [Diploschistes diacapsis]|nr:MAG: hypothetical protein LQ340_003370 [Diploschistes diacapsis]
MIFQIRPASRFRAIFYSIQCENIVTGRTFPQRRLASSAPSKSVSSTATTNAFSSAQKPTLTTTAQSPTPRASDDEPIIQPLDRPLGVPSPPRPGQNSGIDPRTWQERRDDFLDYDKHLERRRELTRKVSKPYFRDWSNLRHHKGKLFLAPQRLLKADKALYFPNLRGITLADLKDEQDTTEVLRGRINIIRVFTGTWAERQADTWTEHGDERVALGNILDAGEGIVQGVNINIEENNLRARLVRFFMRWQRRLAPQKVHGRYFLVTRGVTDEIRHALGMFNTQVGYMFLVDGNCRVRWAGNAVAGDEERASFLRGLVKLIQEMKKLQDLGEGSKDSAARQRLSFLASRLPVILNA